MISEDAFLYKSKASPISKFFSLNIGENLDRITNIIKEWLPCLSVCPYCCTLNEIVLHRSIESNMYKCKKCTLMYIKDSFL